MKRRRISSTSALRLAAGVAGVRRHSSVLSQRREANLARGRQPPALSSEPLAPYRERGGGGPGTPAAAGPRARRAPGPACTPRPGRPRRAPGAREACIRIPRPPTPSSTGPSRLRRRPTCPMCSWRAGRGRGGGRRGERGGGRGRGGAGAPPRRAEVAGASPVRGWVWPGREAGPCCYLHFVMVSARGCPGSTSTMEECQDLRGNAWGRACVGGCALAVGGDTVVT